MGLFTSKEGSGRKRWMILFGVMGVFVAAVTVLLLVVHSSGISAIEQLREKAKQRGEPLTLRDVAARYPAVPPSENGAIALMDLWETRQPALWQAFRRGAATLPDRVEPTFDPDLLFLGKADEKMSRTNPLSPAAIKAAETHLEAEAEYYRALRSALAHPQFRFPIQITNGFNMLLPHLSELKREARQFRVEAFLACDQGRIDQAIGAMEDMASVGKPLAREPFLISALVRLSCYGIVLSEMEHLLSRHALSSGQLERLKKLTAELQASGALRAALLEERAQVMDLFSLSPEQLYQATSGVGSPVPRGFQVGMTLLDFTGLKSADERLAMETFDEALRLEEIKEPGALKDFERLFENLHGRVEEFPPKILSSMFVPSMGRTPQRFAALEARRQSAVVALAVERYRQARGRLPERLEELVPEFISEIPADPFDGHPLRFQTRTPGFVIYSVGRDGADNGGLEPVDRSRGSPFDETFIVDR